MKTKAGKLALDGGLIDLVRDGCYVSRMMSKISYDFSFQNTHVLAVL